MSTLYGISLIGLVNGVVVVEIVFNLPGLGRLMVDSVSARDYPNVQFVILFLVVFAITINLVVDLMYGIFDPRVRVNA